MKKLYYFVIISLFFTGNFLIDIATAKAINTDALIKGQSFTSVYYYGSDGKRYVFPNDKTFFSWYSDFSNVVVITDNDLASIPFGGNVTYKPGKKLVKIETDPKVYAVDKNGLLRWVMNESIAVELYGPGWASQVDDVPDVFFTNYKIGSPISSSTSFSPAQLLAGVTNISNDKTISATDNQISDNTQNTDTTQTTQDNTSSDQTTPSNQQPGSTSSTSDNQSNIGRVTIVKAPDDSDTISRNILAGSERVILAKYIVTSTGEAVTLLQAMVILPINSTDSIRGINIIDSTLLDSYDGYVYSLVGDSKIVDMGIMVPKNSSKTIFVMATLNTQETGADAGDQIYTTVSHANFTARGAESGSIINSFDGSQLTGNILTVQIPIKIVVSYGGPPIEFTFYYKSSGGKPVSVKSISLRQTGTLSDGDFEYISYLEGLNTFVRVPIINNLIKIDYLAGHGNRVLINPNINDSGLGKTFSIIIEDVEFELANEVITEIDSLNRAHGYIQYPQQVIELAPDGGNGPLAEYCESLSPLVNPTYDWMYDSGCFLGI